MKLKKVVLTFAAGLALQAGIYYYLDNVLFAANLDGGSSSTLYMNGNVVNKPADLLGERMIPTAFIVK